MSLAIRILFFVCDLALLNGAIILALHLDGDFYWIKGELNNLYLLIFSNVTWIFLTMVSRPYKVAKSWGLRKILRSQLAFIFIHLLVVASLIFLFKQKYSGATIAYIYVFFTPAFFALRLVTLYLRKIFTDDIPTRNFMLIGRNELSMEIRKYFLMNPESGYKFRGYIDLGSHNFSIERIQAFCQENEVHEIYCCIPDVSEDQLNKLVNFGLDSLIKVKMITATESTRQQSIQLDVYDQPPGRDIATIPLDEFRNQFVKRCFDIFFSTVFNVLVMSWLVPVIAILIKLDSPGPVFFVQLRSGKNNQPFKCLKFRTMVVNAEADTAQASRNDPRVTKLGHFLRKTSIDELPQFLNVLMGSMSVVGPRPHMLKHTDQYSQLIDAFMGRHYVKPGITGLAQCLGYRGETKNVVDMENRVRLDRYYIENWTFWFDIKIIFLTVVSLMRGSDKAF